MNPSSLKFRRTGKIAVLLTILCASQLYGMESYSAKTVSQGSPPSNDRSEQLKPVEFGSEWKTLPNDVKPLIMIALTQSDDNLNDAINTIKEVSLINKELSTMLHDLQGFTKLVHILANKFNIPTSDVAEKINTPTAQTYRQLGMALTTTANNATNENEFTYNNINKLIKNGADVNFESALFTPLGAAIENTYFNVGVIKALLDAGAKVTNNDLEHLNYVSENMHLIHHNQDYLEAQKRKEIIRQLLEEAIKKQQKNMEDQ